MKIISLVCLLFPWLLHSQQFSAIDEYSLNTPNSKEVKTRNPAST